MRIFDIYARFSLIFADYLALLTAFVLAYFIQVGWVFSSVFPFWPYFWVSVTVSFVWIAFFVFFRVYAVRKRTDTREHIARLIAVNLLGTGTFLLFFFTFRNLLFSRWILVYVFLIATVLLVGTHIGSQLMRARLSRKDRGISRLLIIGTNRSVAKFLQMLGNLSSQYKPIVILDGYGSSSKEVAGVPVIGKLNLLEDTVEKYNIHEIIQVDNLEQTLNIIHFCQQKGLRYAMLPSLLGVFHDQIELDLVEFQPVIRLKDKRKHFFENIFGR
jgi:FlaA1/EpsC-like NDP-sugar epimerase